MLTTVKIFLVILSVTNWGDGTPNEVKEISRTPLRDLETCLTLSADIDKHYKEFKLYSKCEGVETHDTN